MTRVGDRDQILTPNKIALWAFPQRYFGDEVASRKRLATI
jgi:hypothetical protein